jgi:hypothetical protein
MNVYWTKQSHTPEASIFRTRRCESLRFGSFYWILFPAHAENRNHHIGRLPSEDVIYLERYFRRTLEPAESARSRRRSRLTQRLGVLRIMCVSEGVGVTEGRRELLNEEFHNLRS